MRHSNLQLLNCLLNMLLVSYPRCSHVDWAILIMEPVVIKLPGRQVVGWKVEQVVGNSLQTEQHTSNNTQAVTKVNALFLSWFVNSISYIATEFLG